MIADYKTCPAVVSSEMCQIAYIGYAGNSFRSGINTALFDLAGFQNPVYLTVLCRCKLTGCINN